jgi:methionyl-tRNA formyltransferase
VVSHFWNYLDRVETGGVTVQRLTEELDAGEIVAETSVDLDDAVTWSEVESRKHRAGVSLLAEAVKNLEDPASEPTVLDGSELGPMYTSDDITPTVVAHYIVSETIATLKSRVGKTQYLLGVLFE